MEIADILIKILVGLVILSLIVKFYHYHQTKKHGQYTTIDICSRCGTKLSFDDIFDCCPKCGATNPDVGGAPDIKKKLRYDAYDKKWLDPKIWEMNEIERLKQKEEDEN